MLQLHQFDWPWEGIRVCQISTQHGWWLYLITITIQLPYKNTHTPTYTISSHACLDTPNAFDVRTM